jgi:uncharacterized protein YbjQ (UPF0145 family)
MPNASLPSCENRLTSFSEHFASLSSKGGRLENFESSKRVGKMIVTTTGSVEGKRIKSYKGLVFGEVVAGVNFLKDFAAGLSNFFGGRSGSYEEELIQARGSSVDEMCRRAQSMGANAVVGVKVDYEVVGSGNSNMLMVIASGTAVELDGPREV